MTDAVTSREFALAAPQTLAMTTRELGALKTDWVRVRFLYCAICGSDLSTFEGRRSIKYPATLGHEFVAQVVATGTDVAGFSIGDVVTSDFNFRCGTCEMCRRGRSHLCERGQTEMFSNRAFAEYGEVDARYLYRLNSPPAAHLTLTEPLSCVLHAKNWADLRLEDSILVVGAGGIGLCMAFALSTSPSPFAFDVIDRVESRVGLLTNAAAPCGRRIREVTGPYDVVFDLSGSEDGLRLACDSVKPGGRLCVMSHLDGYGGAPFLLGALTRRDVTFKVSYLNGEPENLRIAASLLSTWWNVQWEDALEVVPFESLQSAFERRRESPRCKTIVVLS
jgi:threonine dehydrogenase-like Zn-dependent dehydrogenase